MAQGHRIPRERCAGLLGGPRLSQPRRSLGRATLFRRLTLQPILTEATVPIERFQFAGEGGHQLAAALDMPEREPKAYALFAHCFTCGKDVLAAKRISAALALKGI